MSPHHEDPLNPAVLALLEKATGLGDKEAWQRIWLLVSKSEHNNEDLDKAFLTDEGKSLFGYASALKYDMKKRGCTIGIVGWTTANNGKDGKGDAPELFKQYKKLGGEDLMPFVDGCCKSEEKCKKLIAKIHSIEDDPKWIQAQFTNLLTGDGYLAKTMEAFKKVGIPKPSALGLAVVFDTSLNQGFDGPDGGCDHLITLATTGNEEKTLKTYCAWKTKVAGTNEYNDPPSNGRARGKMFADLVDAKCFSLTKECDAHIKKAIDWQMK
jgi:hypothetical protein